ncbi:hypothetical protein I79_009761 [Cricetulus griseus]|uniref:Uncharacterized protein n=1 Tax=Cricetulus griseus TaxID=10029 RepID=G3HGM3_CRIGR|nr:hypothetical protein I79_009761 [Cricetulus griseus]
MEEFHLKWFLSHLPINCVNISGKVKSNEQPKIKKSAPIARIEHTYSPTTLEAKTGGSIKSRNSRQAWVAQ